MPAKQHVATWAVFGAFCAAGVTLAQAQDVTTGQNSASAETVPQSVDAPPQSQDPTVETQDISLQNSNIPPVEGNNNTVPPDRVSNDDGKGLRLGSFVLNSRLEAGVEYNDNVFSSETGEKSDRIYSLNSTLGLKSDWSRHSLQLNLDSARRFYEKNPSEDTTTINATGQARIDIRRNTNLDLRAGFRLSQESRGSTDLNANATRPSDVYGYNASATLNHRINRVSMFLRGGFRAFEYEDTPLSNGTSEDNSDRNNYKLTTTMRVGYDISPRLTVFSELDYSQTVYDQRVDNNGDIRDSNSYGASAGVVVSISDLWNGEVSVGYRRGVFDDPNFDSVDALTANALLTWRPSRLTTLTANLATDLGQTTLAGSSGSVVRTAAVNITHAWRENIELIAGASVQYEKFSGVSLDELTYSFSLGADYSVGRNMTLGARYNFEKFDSSAVGADYEVNTVGVRLTYDD
jgi:hypothetical protein